MQVKHVSRLLAAQLTNAGLGPGIQEEKRRRRMVIEGGDQALPSMEDFEKVSIRNCCSILKSSEATLFKILLLSDGQ